MPPNGGKKVGLCVPISEVFACGLPPIMKGPGGSLCLKPLKENRGNLAVTSACTTTAIQKYQMNGLCQNNEFSFGNM